MGFLSYIVFTISPVWLTNSIVFINCFSLDKRDYDLSSLHRAMPRIFVRSRKQVITTEADVSLLSNDSGSVFLLNVSIGSVVPCIILASPLTFVTLPNIASMFFISFLDGLREHLIRSTEH